MTEKLPDGLSPGKRIQYRSECIDQLAFINERGVISVDEFKSIIYDHTWLLLMERY